MDEFIKLLDLNLNYLKHEIIEDTIYITVESTREEVACPFCGTVSSRIHSTYKRSFYDLPIQGKKVEIMLNNRKMFCDASECKHTTFAERFSWLERNAKKTQRLQEEILRLSINCSSIAASNILSINTISVSKSTICNLLKKR